MVSPEVGFGPGSCPDFRDSRKVESRRSAFYKSGLGLSPGISKKVPLNRDCPVRIPCPGPLIYSELSI